MVHLWDLRGVAAKVETGLFFAPAIEELASRITPEAVTAYRKSTELLNGLSDLADSMDGDEPLTAGDGEVYVQEHVRRKARRKTTAKSE